MFFKILRYDIRRGIIGSPKGHLLTVVLGLLICVGFNFDYSKYYDIHTASFLDIIYYSFAGSPKYVPNKDLPFIFPLVWATVFLLPIYMSSYYPFYDLMGYGKTILIETGSKKAWLLSKTVWCILRITVYFVLFYLTILIFCLVMEIPVDYCVTRNTHEMMIERYYKADVYLAGDYELLDFNGDKSILFLVLPVLIVSVIAMFQMTISLFSTPVYGFLVSAAILVVSTYYLHPALLGNYLMVLRSDQLFNGGVNELTGAITSIILIIIVTKINLMSFRKYDILANIFKDE